MKSIYPFIQGKQPQIGKHIIFDADKNWATCGRIQRDERWWWSTWKEECHLLLTKWNHFIPSSSKRNADNCANQQTTSFLMRTKTDAATVQPAVAFNATKDDDDLLEKKSVIFCWLNEINLSLHPGKAPQIGKHIIFDADNWANAVAFNATKDDDDLLEKKSVIFCWLKKINLSLHPGKAIVNQQTHHFGCGQKLSNLRSHSTRRKMMMIYLKRRVSSFAD